MEFFRQTNISFSAIYRHLLKSKLRKWQQVWGWRRHHLSIEDTYSLIKWPSAHGKSSKNTCPLRWRWGENKFSPGSPWQANKGRRRLLSSFREFSMDENFLSPSRTLSPCFSLSPDCSPACFCTPVLAEQVQVLVPDPQKRLKTLLSFDKKISLSLHTMCLTWSTQLSRLARRNVLVQCCWRGHSKSFFRVDCVTAHLVSSSESSVWSGGKNFTTNFSIVFLGPGRGRGKIAIMTVWSDSSFKSVKHRDAERKMQCILLTTYSISVNEYDHLVSSNQHMQCKIIITYSVLFLVCILLHSVKSTHFWSASLLASGDQATPADKEKNRSLSPEWPSKANACFCCWMHDLTWTMPCSHLKTPLGV